MEDVKPAPSTNKPSGVRLRHPDRITVSPEALERLNAWIADLEGCLKGISLSRNQLVQWLIMSREASLSAQEMKQIESEFFDELKFAEWAVKELRVAQARGERVTLAEIVARSRAIKAEKQREQTQPKRSRKSPMNDAAGAEKELLPAMSEDTGTRIFLDKTGGK